MAAHELSPGDILEHATLPDRTDPAARQRYVVMDVLRLGVRLQPVNGSGRPNGQPLLVGLEHFDALRRLAS